jgi:fructokinase
MMPGSQSLKEKVASILSKGVTLVILTRGGDGAVGYLRDGSEIAVAAQKAVVVDTVGAGDTFNAGVLARLAEMNLLDKAQIKDLSARQTKEILTHGAKVAAVTVSRAGANPPWASEL